MPRFQANFTTYPQIVYAPAKVSFTNVSSLGKAINDEYTQVVDINGNVVTLVGKTVDQFDVSSIEKYEWEFGNNKLSVDENPDHIFEYTGLYNVKLTIYSSSFFDEFLNTFVRIKNSVTKTVDIGSISYAWLQQHMTTPHRIALEESVGFKDLIQSTGKMFDRMYEDIAESVKLIDIRVVAPQFLEFFSDTLGHKRFYAEKVGYSVQDDNELAQPFLEYNIFNRISTGTASDNEIQLFRTFILDTAKLFKQNGSEQAMESFFKLYGFIIDIKELWTTNFGTTPVPAKIDNFFGTPVLEKTINNFAYDAISISGLDNSKGFITYDVSNLIIDNYHYHTKHTYPVDTITDDTLDCEAQFQINDVAPNILAIVRNDGRNITTKENCGGFSPLICSTTDETCTETNVRIEKNTQWSGISKLTQGVNTKIWRVKNNYVQSVINTVGTMPSGVDEAVETPSDTSDDYLWADWKNGITIVPGIPGVQSGQYRKPSSQLLLTNLNLSTTQTDNDIIPNTLTNIDTSRDTFICMRGFIKIDVDGYYNFFLNIGNSGSATQDNHVGLFSLKHLNPYSEIDVKSLENMDNIQFPRSINELSYDVTDGLTTKTIYGRESEYGIIELRQNESSDDGYSIYGQDAGFYKLTPGYYAYEIKTTYNTLNSKKLQLSWQIWNEVVRPTGTYFEVIQSQSIIPTNVLLTFDESEKSIEDTVGKGILTIPHELLEGADAINVVYYNTPENTGALSGFISTDGKMKDGEIIIRLSPLAIDTYESIENLRTPNKKFGIIFRGIHTGNDLYSNVDDYYAFIMDGRIGEYSITKITYDSTIDDVYVRYLNLNKNSTELDKREFFGVITDEYNHTVELYNGTYYDFKVSVSNNKVSVYYKENNEFTTTVQRIQQSLSVNLQKYDVTSDVWINLVSDIDLLQDDVQTETMDIQNNILDIPQKYVPIQTEGTYGFFAIDSMFKINRYIVNSFDDVDYNRLETDDKYKQIKPKYLDTHSTSTLKYNSYEVDESMPTFNIKVFSDYNGEHVSILPTYIGQIDDNSVNKVFANNVDVSNKGSRLNILFDSAYINDRFSNTTDVLDTLCVPIGRFFEPYVDWSYVNNDFTSIPIAGYTQLISEVAKVSPHTIATIQDINGDQIVEQIGKCARVASDYNQIYLNTTLNTFIKATNNISYSGFWEEVCPYSTNETINVPTLGVVHNPIFDIIKRNDLVVGVKINNMSAFEKLQCRYCDDATIWGLFELQFTRSTLSKLPKYLSSLGVSSLDDLTLDELNQLQIECTGTINSPYEDECDPLGININNILYFIPIGKLNSEYVTFLPPAGILENPDFNISLLGVYAHLAMDKFTSNDDIDNIKFIINKINDFEALYKSKVQCNYFIDAETSFIANVTKYNDTSVYKNIPEQCNYGEYLYTHSDAIRDENGCGDFISNAYFIPDSIVNITKHLQTKYPVQDNNQIDENFAREFAWWMPNDLWLQRKFSVVYPENTNNVLYTGFSDVGNNFYGHEISSAGVKIVFNDDISVDTGVYLLDSKWCVTTTGWDTTYFQIPGLSGEYTTVEINENMYSPFPLQTVSMSGQTYVTFGEYYNLETYGKRTFTPVGLFNWMQTHSDGISGSDIVGWDVSDWNDAFKNCFEMKNVYMKIPKNAYDLNKYWGFFNDHIPPVASKINITYANRNCYSIDGENSPDASDYNILLGISDGNNGFYYVPPVVEPYYKWISTVDKVYVDNYTFAKDEYSVVKNTTDVNKLQSQLNLKTDIFSFNEFIGSDIYLNFFVDKLFDLDSSKKLTDNFGSKREISWCTCVENDNNYYSIGQRDIDVELKYTSNSLPYNITTYKNNIVYQASNKFINTNTDTTGGTISSESRTKNIVGIDNNNGFPSIMSLLNIESNNYSIECDFIFDKDMINTSLDKKFELILKAENNYIVKDKKWGITDYYYVGTGTNGFDIGLGMKSYDQSTGKVQDTFLVSFGDYNLRNISVDTWYTLRADISSENIKVFFYERGTAPLLVLNYNINKKYEKLTERYLKGEYETLQSLIIGLEQLMITYPNKLSEKVSDNYTFDKFKDEFAGTLPIDGQYSGFRVFNEMTYVGQVRYIGYIPKTYKWGSAYDSSGFNTVLYKIINNFRLPSSSEIQSVQSGLDGNIYIQIDDALFYYKEGSDPEQYINPIHTFSIVHDKIIIVEKEVPENGGIGINHWEPGTHTITWVLKNKENTYSANTYNDLLRTITNATSISITRTFTNGNIVTREVGYVSGMSGDISGSNSIITVGDEVTITIGGDRVIQWPLNGKLALYDLHVRAYQEGFVREFPILIKDKTFYTDNLKKYMTISDKHIKDVYINDSLLHLIFEDN